jgi:hypothetical protein
MLGYANLAKAWNVAHNGGERVDPRNGSASAEAIAEKANWKEGQCSPAQAAVEEKGQPHTGGSTPTPVDDEAHGGTMLAGGGCG